MLSLIIQQFMLFGQLKKKHQVTWLMQAFISSIRTSLIKLTGLKSLKEESMRLLILFLFKLKKEKKLKVIKLPRIGLMLEDHGS